METFIAEYGTSNDLRAVKSPLRICPIVARSFYQGGGITRMTWDVSVDLVYSPREDYSVQILSPDFPNKEIFFICTRFSLYHSLWGLTSEGVVKDFYLKVISVMM